MVLKVIQMSIKFLKKLANYYEFRPLHKNNCSFNFDIFDKFFLVNI